MKSCGNAALNLSSRLLFLSTASLISAEKNPLSCEVFSHLMKWE